MKPITEVNVEPITFEAGPLTEVHLKEFREATSTEFTPGFPPTYATVFRKAEFDFLDRFKVDMRLLLHVDQEYIYLVALRIGDTLNITTSVGEIRERRGMHFVTLHTDFVCKGEAKIRSNTTFVVRDPRSAGRSETLRSSGLRMARVAP